MADGLSRRQPERPLSPHLSVYRFTWTMAMSIAHRITGIVAYCAAPLLALWLWAIADGAESYEWLVGLARTWIGTLILIGVSWALIHHTIGGIRHIVWDTGTGLDRAGRFLWAQATLLGSVILTVVLWLTILGG